MAPRSDVLCEVLDEMVMQDRKWGEQNHPDFMLTASTSDRCEIYEIPTEEEAKALIAKAVNAGECTWTHVLLEEFCEAVETLSDANLRAELIQVAAVAVQWIGAIDRRNA